MIAHDELIAMRLEDPSRFPEDVGSSQRATEPWGPEAASDAGADEDDAGDIEMGIYDFDLLDIPSSRQ